MSFPAFYLQLFTAVPLLSQRSHWALFFYWLQYMRVQLLPHVTSYFPQVQLYCWLSYKAFFHNTRIMLMQNKKRPMFFCWHGSNLTSLGSSPSELCSRSWPDPHPLGLLTKEKTSRHNCHKLCMSNQTRASLTKHFKVNIFCKNGVEWAMSLKKFRGWNSENIQLP